MISVVGFETCYEGRPNYETMSQDTQEAVNFGRSGKAALVLNPGERSVSSSIADGPAFPPDAGDAPASQVRSLTALRGHR
jgi:hypothetical protein